MGGLAGVRGVREGRGKGERRSFCLALFFFLYLSLKQIQGHKSSKKKALNKLSLWTYFI